MNNRPRHAPTAEFDRRRALLVERGIRAEGVDDPAVLRAMSDVRREAFVPPALRDEAYRNAPLPIARGQTISQPLVVASMAQALRLRPTDRVLEIGAGSGYAAAVLSRLCAAVFTVERHAELAHAAASLLHELGFDNVHVRLGDGAEGWPEQAPFDGIVAAAAATEVPPALPGQLAPGGRLVLPIGPPGGDQRLVRITRRPDGRLVEADLGGVRFVPLVPGIGTPE